MLWRERRVSRRRAVGGIGAIAAAGALAACAAPAPPTPSSVPAPARGAEPATQGAGATPAAATAPSAARPASPAAQPTTPTAGSAPPAATKPATAPASKPGRSLIGKLEGPTIITDPAQFPKELKEPPALAELVKAGRLPPVKERVGEDPLVIKPLHEIGKHGGTWRRGFIGPNDTVNGIRAVQNDKLLYFDYTGQKIVPNIAKGWQVSDDGRTTTLFLRRGMKWSDGQPFTADDFVFWFQDVYQNKELVTSPLFALTINAKPVTMEKVDTYTVRYRAPDPHFLLPNFMAYGQLGHHARYGRDGLGGFAPAHYLKPFHPKYTSKEELDKKVAEAKVDNWALLFKLKSDSARNPDLPVLTAWKTTVPITTPTWTLERNPYSVYVDSDGNQLPYIDKCVMTLGENLEVINLRAIAGEFDEQARHIDIGKLPVLLDNQEKGGYRVYLDPSDQGSDLGMYFNQTYDADPEIQRWLTNRDFRISLSSGIDRDQINETFVLGLGQVGSAAPSERTTYSPGPEYRALHSTFDLKKANDLLDKLGLDKKDSEGYRLRTDGTGRLRLEVVTYLGFLQFTQMMEMVKQQWKKIGVDLNVRELERGLQQRRTANNENQIVVETQWGGDDVFGNGMFFPSAPGSDLGPLYGQWFASGGARGKEPPPKMRELMDKYRSGYSLPEKERIELGKQIWRTALDELWTINVVANSPASQGVRIAKTSLGNIPERMWNSALSDNPMIAHPETYFFRR